MINYRDVMINYIIDVMITCDLMLMCVMSSREHGKGLSDKKKKTKALGW